MKTKKKEQSLNLTKSIISKVTEAVKGGIDREQQLSLPFSACQCWKF
jgi:hypothetical protein